MGLGDVHTRSFSLFLPFPLLIKTGTPITICIHIKLVFVVGTIDK